MSRALRVFRDTARGSRQPREISCDTVSPVRIVTRKLRDLEDMELGSPWLVTVTPYQFLEEMKS